MKQIVAIVLKDIRRFWPELAVSFALLIALVLIYPATWRVNQGEDLVVPHNFMSEGGAMGFISVSLVVLVPIGWLILIARLVHCERLIGDTQFWITRPYEWPKLLTAKLIFLALFLYVPFFIAQCVLLAEAGFHPLEHLGGLVFNLLLLTAAAVFPLLAFSALTTGFARLILVLLGCTLFIAAVAVVRANLPSDVYNSVPDIISGRIAFAILVCGCAAAVVLQYGLRGRRIGWLVLLAAAAMMCVMGLVDPDRVLVERYYPAVSVGAPPPVQFSYSAEGLAQPMTSESRDKGRLDISLPLSASGVANGYAVVPMAVMATIEAPNGEGWHSPWQGVERERFGPGVSAAAFRFRIRQRVYDRFKNTPVRLRLTIAVDQAAKIAEPTIAMPADDFTVPGFGVCAPDTWLGPIRTITGIHCRSAMNQPQLTLVSLHWSEGPCSKASDETGAQVAGTAWAGTLDPDPAEFGISSVWDVPVIFSNFWMPRNSNSNDAPHARHICPGTPVSFAEYKLVNRARVDLSIEGFRLPEVSLGDRLLLLSN